MPKISVLIPAYNAERTIKETIESVQKQTFSNFELIVINDGSTDSTLDKLYTIKDQRLKIFNYENGGVCLARNRGISHATGDLIAFLDADDLWMPDKLELQLVALQNNSEAKVAYSWTYYMYEKKDNFLFHACPANLFTGNVYEQLLIGDFIYSASNVLVDREAIDSIGEFDSACAGCADWDYWLRLSSRFHFAVVPKYQILYRQSTNSMSSKVETMKEEALVALEKAYQLAPSQLQCLKNKTLVNFHQYVADLYLNYRNDTNSLKQAGQHLRTAIYLEPQIFLRFSTQRTLIKFLLKRVFPNRIYTYLLQLLSQTRTVTDPRL